METPRSTMEKEEAISRSDVSSLERPDDSSSLPPKELEAGVFPSSPSLPAIESKSDPETAPAEPSTPEYGPPPDGGLEAWLQVLGATIILVDTWGLINTFGVFQAFYEEDILSSSSPSDISWIGSLQASLLLVAGVVSGPLHDAGHFRNLLRVGIFLIIFGMFMTSLCTAYWQFILAQGICVGLGMGLTFLPSAAILSQYFHRHRALVLGLSSAGSPVAGIVFPVIFSKLQPVIGFGWATRVIAFILLGLSVIPLVFMRTRLPPSGSKRGFVDMTAFRDAPYMTFTAAGFFSFLTLYVPFFYMAVFATTHNITSADFAPYLVTFLNLGSIFGRIIPNALADKYGALNVLTICMAATTVVGYGWLGIDNLAGSVVFALLYGALSGGVVSLTPTVIVSLSPDLGSVGVRMGMGFLVTGTSLLVGTPIAGAIVKGYSDASWTGTMVYAATGILLATILYALSRFQVYKRQGGWRF